MLSDREGEPVAVAFMREGFDTFVLYYSLGDDSAYPGPLDDAAKAIWYVRSHAEEWGIDPDAIAVMGFSAGAHLSSLISTQWNYNGLEDRLGIPAGGAKPNAAVLGYGPYVAIERESEPGDSSLGKMLAEPPDEFNVYKYVNEGTPPLFI